MTLDLRRLDGKYAMLPSFAAAMAFYFLVSLVPFLIVVSRAVVWLFAANPALELVAFLRDVLPPESRLRPEAISAAVQSGGGAGLGALSTLIAAWTVSGGFNELARAVHFVFSDARHPHPGGWLRRLKAFGLLALWTAAIAAASVFLVLIPLARQSLPLGGFHRLFAALIRYPVAFALMFAAFSLTYAYVPEPEHRPSRRAAMGGGLVAAIAWMATCLLFAFFLPRVWGVSLFRGVLSSALATLVWAYCGCWGVLLGACWAAAAADGPSSR